MRYLWAALAAVCVLTQAATGQSLIDAVTGLLNDPSPDSPQAKLQELCDFTGLCLLAPGSPPPPAVPAPAPGASCNDGKGVTLTSGQCASTCTMLALPFVGPGCPYGAYCIPATDPATQALQAPALGFIAPNLQAPAYLAPIYCTTDAACPAGQICGETSPENSTCIGYLSYPNAGCEAGAAANWFTIPLPPPIFGPYPKLP